MTWTYDSKQLSTSQMMTVRLNIGDTDSTDQQMQDEEILYAISTRTNTFGAAAECCRMLANKYARQVDSSIGDLRASFSQKWEHYLSLAAVLDGKAAETGGGMPYAGGISEADKEAQLENPDAVQSQYALGMTDNNLPVPSVGNETLVPKP